MKQRLLQALIFLVVVLLSGCGSAPQPSRTAVLHLHAPVYVPRPPDQTDVYLNRIVPMWIGHQSKELIEAWGDPTEAGESTGGFNGRAAYSLTYKFGTPGPTTVIPNYYARRDMEGNYQIDDNSTVLAPHWAVVHFVSDSDGKIINASWLGLFPDVFIVSDHPQPTGESHFDGRIETKFENSNGGYWTDQPPEKGDTEDVLEKLRKK